LAKTPRTWTGARTPSGLKRVRQAERRHAILQPRRSAAKTFVAKALAAATGGIDGVDPAEALRDAVSALDLAAKVGAIHPNAAARRKSRLAVKVNAAVGGAGVQAGTRTTKQTGKAAASKAARARIAAGRADKAKGAQTAAGKARAALSRSARTETPGVKPEAAATAAKAPGKATSRSTAKPAGTKPAGTKSAATKPAATKPAASKPAGKTSTRSSTATKTSTARAAAKKPAEKKPAAKADKKPAEK
jgi:ribosomal protein S20